MTPPALTRRRTALWGVLALALTGLTVLPGTSSGATAACPWIGSSASPATKAAQVVAKMTTTEKVQFVSGANNNGPSAGLINGISRLCIPKLVLNDASAGLGNKQTGTTAYPDEIGQAATWDTSLQTAMGKALGAEAVAKGVNVIFGPGANLARNPLNGRGFEYPGEDPYLAGKTVTSLVQGIQSQHVIATVKHFALNDQETNRTTESSNASERTAAELYFVPFEAAVKGGAGAVMCAYNRVNSSYACSDPSLLNGVLKGRLGFTGFVVSDFEATHATKDANAGLDMEMPTAKYFGGYLLKAVQAGRVSTKTLNGMVTRVLTSMFRIGLVDHPPTTPVSTSESASNVAVAARVAREGSVLLKNTGVLPLASTIKKIAVIGDGGSFQGAQRASQGYGSAHVPQFAYNGVVRDPVTALTNRAAKIGATVTYNDGTGQTKAVLAAAQADVAIVFVNDVENEGVDRPDLKPHGGTCSISGANTCDYSSVDQDQLVSAVAAANRNTIVVLQTGGPVEMPWLSSVAGVVENWLPGEVDGDALAPLLFGDVNFSGKLPVTFPVSQSDDPITTASQYPGVTDSKGIPQVTYSEGLDIGYRWYDAKKITPMFPFGFGLSYTTFAYSGLRLTSTSTGLRVALTVRNTGSRSGAEVAQVYVSDPASAGEPPKALAGFFKMTVPAGTARSFVIPVASRAFEVWSTTKHAFVPVTGCFVLRAGGSSTNLPLIAKVARNGGHC